ncbi:MAG: FAD-binding oxidoreductase [Pseudomonadales bacterium]|nr:FAD-binding oxidoreductase [Pseudomonadales bacterium]
MNFETIIIGGGIIGCATAHYLARSRGQRVALIEQNLIGSGTTSQAASMLIRSRPDPTLAAMVNETFTTLKQLQDELEDDLGYREVGCLHVGNKPDTRSIVQQNADAARAAGINIEALSPAEARKCCPWLNIDSSTALRFCPEDGYIDGYQLAMAYARQARKRGVTIFQNMRVEQLLTSPTGEKQNKRISGITLANGEQLFCNKLVLTGGPWTTRLAAQLDILLPMAPVRSQYWITTPDQRFPSASPMTILPDAKAYTRPEVGALLFGLRDNQSVVAAPEDLPSHIHSFQFDADTEGLQALEDGYADLIELIPALETAALHQYISGVSSYTPDGRYIIGATTIDGLYVGTGCCGAGVAMSAGFGRILAELVLDQTPFVPIDTFNPNRFPLADPFSRSFRQECAQARSRKR